jgi:hypothetical protein
MVVYLRLNTFMKTKVKPWVVLSQNLNQPQMNDDVPIKGLEFWPSFHIVVHRRLSAVKHLYENESKTLGGFISKLESTADERRWTTITTEDAGHIFLIVVHGRLSAVKLFLFYA